MFPKTSSSKVCLYIIYLSKISSFLCNFVRSSTQHTVLFWGTTVSRKEKMASYNVNNVSRYITEIVRSKLTEHNYLNSAWILTESASRESRGPIFRKDEAKPARRLFGLLRWREKLANCHHVSSVIIVSEHGIAKLSPHIFRKIYVLPVIIKSYSNDNSYAVLRFIPQDQGSRHHIALSCCAKFSNTDLHTYKIIFTTDLEMGNYSFTWVDR